MPEKWQPKHRAEEHNSQTPTRKHRNQKTKQNHQKFIRYSRNTRIQRITDNNNQINQAPGKTKAKFTKL